MQGLEALLENLVLLLFLDLFFVLAETAVAVIVVRCLSLYCVGWSSFGTLLVINSSCFEAGGVLDKLDAKLLLDPLVFGAFLIGLLHLLDLVLEYDLLDMVLI